MDEQLKKYFQILNKIRSGKAGKDEIEFFLSYTPEIDQTKLQKLVEGGNFVNFNDAQAAVIEAGRALQTSPEYKEQMLEIGQQVQAGKIAGKVAEGVNMVLGGVDIATSINQIRQGDRAARNSRRPSRPSIPQRDVLLQQALRGAEEGTFDSERAIAPVRQEIQDQFLNDIQGAKTASTGQAGAYGAYRQLAANRRNRAAMELAPVSDAIKAREQARYDNLLGMRQDETQQMFRNQASLYPFDLQQYSQDQQAAASLGATGRANLRDSLYNFGGQAANFIGNQYAQRYNRLANQAVAAGIDPEPVFKAEENLRKYMGINYRPSFNPQQYEQSFIG